MDLKVSPPKSLYRGGWHGHMIFAQWIIRVLNPRSFVELGTHNGDSYFSFCQSVKEHDLRTLCHAVDTWQGEPHAGFYGEDIYNHVEEYNTRLYSNFSTLHRCFFDEALNEFEDGSIDLLHIDGFHTYEAVKHDFETWKPKLSENAVVLFHDAAEVQRDFGVWKFWDELEEKYPGRCFLFLHSHGLGILGVGELYPQELLYLFQHYESNPKDIQTFFEKTNQYLLEPKEKELEAQLSKQYNIYIDTGAGLSEKEKESTENSSSQGKNKFFLTKHRGIELIRIDFGRTPKIISIDNLVLTRSDKTIFYPDISNDNSVNKISMGTQTLYVFTDINPRIWIKFNKDEEYISLSYNYEIIGDERFTIFPFSRNLINKLGKADASIEKNKQQISDKNNEILLHLDNLKQMESVNTELKVQFELLHQDMESKNKELESKDKELESKDKELESKDKELESKDKELESKDKELESKDKELESKDKELESKDKELESKDKELESKDKELESKDKELESKDKELESKDKELESKDKELESKDKELESKDKELESKDKELEVMNNMDNEIRMLKINENRNSKKILNLNNKVSSVINLERERINKKYRNRRPLRLIKRCCGFFFHPKATIQYVNDIKLINKSGLFDEDFYISQNNDLISVPNLLRHFMHFGFKEKRNPHPLFDVEYYLGINADVKKAGINPLLHFLKIGYKEGRNPHPFFDVKFYYDNNSDVKKADVNPLVHYIRHGYKEGRKPNPNFDTEYYLRKYIDVKNAGINPLIHYVEYGIYENRETHSPNEMQYKTNNNDYIVQIRNSYDKKLDILSYKDIYKLRKDFNYEYSSKIIGYVNSYLRNKGKNNKIVVYTALVGNYDELKIPETLSLDIDYICFTDRFYTGVYPWELREIEYNNNDPTMITRYYKLHPHLLFPNYEIVIWIDSSLLIRETCDLHELIKKHNESGKLLSTSKHPFRNCVYEEIEACIRSKKGNIEKLTLQQKHYKQKNLPSNFGLAETGFIINSNRHPAISNFYSLWWKELENYSHRDQISFPYILYRLSLEYNSLFDRNYNYRNDKKILKFYIHRNETHPIYKDIYNRPKLLMEKLDFIEEKKDSVEHKKVIIGIVVNTLEDNISCPGTSYIRLIIPILNLTKSYDGIDYCLLNNEFIENNNTEWYKYIDIIFCNRNVIKKRISNKIIEICKNMQIPIIYDIDDNMLMNAPNYIINDDDKKNVSKIIDNSSIKMASTIPLVNLIRSINNSNVFLHQNYLDKTLCFIDSNLKKKKNNTIKILYMGTRSHDEDLSIIDEAVDIIMNKYSNVEFYIIGGTKTRNDRYHYLSNPSKNYIEFSIWFKEIASDFDFALCPLINTKFNEYKSYIKFVDYSSKKIPAIYSNHPIYKKMIRNYDNGIIIENDINQWVVAMEYYINNSEERIKIGTHAYLDVEKFRSIDDDKNEKLLNIIKKVIPKEYNIKRLKSEINITKVNYRTLNDMFIDISRHIDKVPQNIDLIVGIPRSGIIPAYYLGMILNLPVITYDEFKNNITTTTGDRKIQKKEKKNNNIQILFVDDSINMGRSYHRITENAPKKYNGKDISMCFLSIYSSGEKEFPNAKFMIELKNPRIFQWNYRNHAISDKSCYDIDGVLCDDPEEWQNDDGDKYIEFIRNAKPLYIPNYRIRALVTSRLEKYREHTEYWLTKNNVKYKELYMLDLPSKQERIKQKAHTKIKIDIYRKLTDTILFVESSERQAKIIAEATGKSVICTENDRIY